VLFSNFLFSTIKKIEKYTIYYTFFIISINQLYMLTNQIFELIFQYSRQKQLKLLSKLSRKIYNVIQLFLIYSHNDLDNVQNFHY